MYNEWNEPLKKWDAHRVKDFFTWAREVYGEEPFKEMVESYRAVMDVKNSVEEPIERQPTQIITSAGMVKMAQEILNNSMREVIEKHEHGIL